MKPTALASAVTAAATLGLLAPTVATASEVTAHNGTGAGASVPASAAGSPNARHTITFDTGASACDFGQSAPLREEYAAVGAHFTGPTDDTGGAILDECAQFGVDARSGTEFFAFNNLTYAVWPEQVRFDELQRKVRLFVADGVGDGTATFELTGLRGGEVVASKSITTAEPGWVRIKVRSPSGIDEVTLTGDTSDDAFVVDDLKFRDL